jgi:hypothetical protein
MMRWSRYAGDRISRPGWRASLLVPSEWRGALSRRVYGCVWEEKGEFRGYFERERPGEVEDAELGPFASFAEAKRAVEAALRAEYPNHY